MNKTLCKFKIDNIASDEKASIKQPDGTWKEGTAHVVEASAVSTGSKENDEFFAATPSGSLHLAMVRDEFVKDFKIGDEIYVTIEKAPAPAVEEEAAASPGTL